MKHGLFLVSALALVAGCEKADKAASIADDNLAPGEVRLIGAGVDPKAVLRYQIDKGTSVTLDMVMNIGIDAGGMPVPQMPTIRMSMTQTCTDVDAAGNMRFDMKVDDMGADGTGEMAQAMGMVKDMMKDMEYRFTLTPSGKITDVQVTGLTGPMAQMGTQMKESIEQFAAPLPEEPVGKGSKWRFKKAGEANGIKMATVNDFELVELKDQVATFKVKGRVTAPRQTMNQGGMEVQVEKMTGNIQGTIANDLRRLAPTGSFDMKMDMTMAAGGQKVNMSMTVDTEITAR